MADWLILLLKYGGFAAVLVLALFVTGKWLVKRITAALDSYTTAYLQQRAAIDARIVSLEKLVEEQAKLTRTVESIKDEIAAQAKSRDNRWEFRKDVYVRLITNVVDLINVYSRILSTRAILQTEVPDEAKQKLNDQLGKCYLDLTAKGNEFDISSSLVRIATADTILNAILKAPTFFQATPTTSPQYDATVRDQINNLAQFLTELHFASRKDLWSTPEPEAKAGAAT